MIEILTRFPVALDSPDHIQPWGTKNDNSSCIPFIEEIERKFFNNQKINFMDLGCSGGLLVHDFLNRGHLSVGLEGSDFSLKNERAQWPAIGGTNLFTCDIAKPFLVTESNKKQKNKQILFDLISAWEVIEHIHPDDLPQFFLNVNNHLKSTGYFLGTISTKIEIIEDVVLHQSVFPESKWKQEILPEYFVCEDYTSQLDYAVRSDIGSFHFLLRKK